MVAYSFRREFVDGIEAETKLHTIRGDRRRHARPGEEVQLYYAMRTKACALIARKACTQFLGVKLRFSGRERFGLFQVAQLLHGEWDRIGPIMPIADPEAFAIADGFAGGLDAMGRFWRDVHGRKTFGGFLIGWGAPYLVAPPPLELAEPDPAPEWVRHPFSARPADVARAIGRGDWAGAGLRRYRSLADGRVYCRQREEDGLQLYELVAAPGTAAVGPYAELEELARALIRYDRQRVDDDSWSEPQRAAQAPRRIMAAPAPRRD